MRRRYIGKVTFNNGERAEIEICDSDPNVALKERAEPDLTIYRRENTKLKRVAFLDAFPIGVQGEFLMDCT